MVDLGEAAARPADRRRALLAAGAVTICAVMAIPFAGVPLGTSTIASTLLATSIVTTAVVAMLLWAQARVTHSTPLLVLGAVYVLSVVMMIPAAGADGTSWPYLGWHLVFASAPIVYVFARRIVRRRAAAPYARTQRVVVASTTAAIVVAGLIALHSDGRQPVSPPGVVAAGTVFLALDGIALLILQNRFRSVLDMWLGVAALCTIADVLLAQWATAFTVGWYLSRTCAVVATGSILVALIVQTTNVYAQLAKTAERLRSESLTDTLTGLTNRRGFDAQLAIAMGDGKRTARGAALLMIDLDNFKTYNDTFGHPAGDRCLRVIAKTLCASVNRNRDVVARFGGEEFAVIMPETNLRGAAIVAERVRASIEALAMPSGRAARHPVVTVSIGVAAVNNAVDSTPPAMLADADRALYGAKQSGRNRIVAASPVRFAPVA